MQTEGYEAGIASHRYDYPAMGRERLRIGFDVQSVSVEMLYQRLLDEMTGPEIALTLQADLSSSGEVLLVGAVPLLSLYAFHTVHQKPERGACEGLHRLDVRLQDVVPPDGRQV